MSSYNSLDDRNRDNQMALILSTNGYIHENKTVEDVMNYLNKFYRKPEEIESDYSHQISYWLDKVEIMSNVLRMRKLENNRKDAMYLLDRMKEYIDKVQETILEVNE